ncbi:serine/threonine-protein kinase DCLK1-like [Tubulanus polymorphus]|uniref:serine/threonine-protein kinase DCLK1-like n=1 Tax=Tubulanus polymorphus TaxID=672921 RepID=UPI003DA58DC2
MATETNGYGLNEHFQSDDGRSYSRNGSSSPARARSMMNVVDGRRAKKVRFYRNGDRFYKGLVYAVSPDRFRTFESLLAELTSSPLCNRVVLPNGVRAVFSLDGTRKISDLEQLEDGESYVCASGEIFKKAEYQKSRNPTWNPNVKTFDTQEGFTTSLSQNNFDLGRDVIKPKLVTVIRNGMKPRKAVRILLNRKTAKSFDQVLTDITNAIKLDSGAVRKIFTLDGKPVSNLMDFFQDESVFIAYGQERFSLDDFDLDDNEVKYVSAYRPGTQKDRVTLGNKSPKAQRRQMTASSRSLNEGNFDFSRSAPTSPRFVRRTFTSPRSPMRVKRPTQLNNKVTSDERTTPDGHPCTNGILSEGTPSPLISKYEILKLIGEGNFAVVKECREKSTGKDFALKIIDKKKCKGKEKMIENEVSILRRIQHSNIVTLIEEFDSHNELYLVMELVGGGDLFDAISAATKYTEKDASGMLYNLSCALKYLHSQNIVHRDVKPENLLVYDHEDGTKSLKLGDFGLATVVREPLYVVCGTPTYVAPEILEETGYGLKVDVWAAGVITYILLCGFPPFVSTKNDQDELFKKIMSGEFEFRKPYWNGMSDSAKELIANMLQVDPDRRFTAGQVLEHPWVSDDTAQDNDFHETIHDKITANFERKRKFGGPAGVSIIASTALDKGSRFFQGPKNQMPVAVYDQDTDEVF